MYTRVYLKCSRSSSRLRSVAVVLNPTTSSCPNEKFNDFNATNIPTSTNYSAMTVAVADGAFCVEYGVLTTPSSVLNAQ